MSYQCQECGEVWGNTYFNDVLAFHLAWNDLKPHLPRVPTALSDEAWARRVRLILEEFAETAEAHSLGNFPEFADGLVDLTWVVIGSAVEAGLPFDRLWAEVRRANMDKFRNGIRMDSNGKVLKPEGWVGPQIEKILNGEL